MWVTSLPSWKQADPLPQGTLENHLPFPKVGYVVPWYTLYPTLLTIFQTLQGMSSIYNSPYSRHPR